MSITKSLLAGVAGTVLVGSGALAGEPLKLTETQMDDVTAGFSRAIAVVGDAVAFGAGRGVSRTANISFSADDALRIGSGDNVSIVERGEAKASFSGSFRGVGGLSLIGADPIFGTSIGVYAGVTNDPRFGLPPAN